MYVSPEAVRKQPRTVWFNLRNMTHELQSAYIVAGSWFWLKNVWSNHFFDTQWENNGRTFSRIRSWQKGSFLKLFMVNRNTFSFDLKWYSATQLCFQMSMYFSLKAQKWLSILLICGEQKLGQLFQRYAFFEMCFCCSLIYLQRKLQFFICKANGSFYALGSLLHEGKMPSFSCALLRVPKLYKY